MKYARLYDFKPQPDAEPDGEGPQPKPNGIGEAAQDTVKGENIALRENSENEPVAGITSGNQRQQAASTIKPAGQEPIDRNVGGQELTIQLGKTDKSDEDVASPSIDAEVDVAQLVQDTTVRGFGANDENMSPEPQQDSVKGDAGQDGVIMFETGVLSNLEIKILEIDARPNLKEVRPSINAWKAFRGKRSNQDLGTLFEMREEFYVWKYSKLPKAPRSGNSAYGLR